jgi:SulP family sulfate permease
VRLIRGAPKVDVGILLLTFLLTVFVDLVVAVNVGVILAALFFMRRMADSVNVEQQSEVSVSAPGHTSESALAALPANSGIVIFNIDGPVFFGAAEKLERTLEHIQRPATTLILRMGNVPFVDATGIFAIEEIVGDFKRHGAVVLLVEVRPNVRFKLERGGVIANVGAENVLDTFESALTRARELQAAAAPIPPPAGMNRNPS